MNRSDRVLAYITSYTMKHGYPPTVREICDGADLHSSSVAHYYLVKLEREGRIVRTFGSPRAIRVLSTVPTAEHGQDA